MLSIDMHPLNFKAKEKSRSLLVAVVVCTAYASGYETYSNSNVIYRDIKWTGGESVKWPCPVTKQLYRSNGRFISKNMLATRVAVDGDNAYVVLPRFRRGIPFTLGKLSLRGKGCEARMTPFPSWSLHEEGECAALQSAVDLFLEPSDGVLWVLDTGIVKVLDAPIRRCPPKVVALNVETGKLVKSVDLSPLANNISRLQYVIADYASDGRLRLYVSDAANRAILVFDVTSGHGYRVALPEAVAEGCVRRDVLALALVHRPDGGDWLVFSYLSGRRMFAARSEHLRPGIAGGAIVDVGLKTGKYVLLGTDNASAIFFRKEGESDVYRSDLFGSRGRDKARRVYEGSEYRLPTHVVADYRRDRMRVLESNFADYFGATVGCGAEHALAIFEPF